MEQHSRQTPSEGPRRRNDGLQSVVCTGAADNLALQCDPRFAVNQQPSSISPYSLGVSTIARKSINAP
jgi:hypothetical protein